MCSNQQLGAQYCICNITKGSKVHKTNHDKTFFWIFCFGIVKLAYREYSGGAVISPVKPALSSRSSTVSWHSSYCCTNLHTESSGRIIVLKYEFSPSDLPVVLVNGKNLFLKYARTYICLIRHMFFKCLFSATSKHSNMCCHVSSNSSTVSELLIQV